MTRRTNAWTVRGMWAGGIATLLAGSLWARAHGLAPAEDGSEPAPDKPAPSQADRAEHEPAAPSRPQHPADAPAQDDADDAEHQPAGEEATEAEPTDPGEDEEATEAEPEDADEDGEPSRVEALTPEAGMAGWKLFFSKNCVKCHSIWGRGGEGGPDLGRARVGPRSEAELVAKLWNSIPRMSTFLEKNERVPFQPISAEEMRDLFTFFFFLRYMDAPGDPRRGRLAFLRHGCQTCHALSGEGGAIGPDLAKWSRYTNPVVWSQKMWQAAPAMEAEMRRQGMKWPIFEPGEIVDMIGFIRSVSVGYEKEYLELGSPAAGAQLFRSSQCVKCHAEPNGPGPYLAEADLPGNMAELVARIWNHAPEMIERMHKMGYKPVEMSSQEMAHISAYLLSLQYLDVQGDPAKGKELFQRKGCAKCHESGTEAAPALADMHADGAASYLAHRVWNTGRSMLREMATAGVQWPAFTADEMRDLLAYLREGE